jgi:hypothetical protein
MADVETKRRSDWLQGRAYLTEDFPTEDFMQFLPERRKPQMRRARHAKLTTGSSSILAYDGVLAPHVH